MKTNLAVSSLVVLALAGCASNSDVKESNLTFTPFEMEGDDNVVNLCPKPVNEIYMVMPEEGAEGTVVVTFSDGREEVLHGDYSAMTVAGDETVTYVSNGSEMRDLFGEAVNALPPAPSTQTLYFTTGTTDFNQESKALAADIYEDVVSRQSPEVIVSGHTDTVGTTESNQTLSEKRANAVSEQLIKSGVAPDTITATGYGETELMVETEDNVEEQLNRRVEINVR
jgi:outer membrane protein OmpA-like peptidoglycan-associated protein